MSRLCNESLSCYPNCSHANIAEPSDLMKYQQVKSQEFDSVTNYNNDRCDVLYIVY